MPAARDSALDKLYRIVLALAGVYGGLSVLYAVFFCYSIYFPSSGAAGSGLDAGPKMVLFLAFTLSYVIVWGLLPALFPRWGFWPVVIGTLGMGYLGLSKALSTLYYVWRDIPPRRPRRAYGATISILFICCRC